MPALTPSIDKEQQIEQQASPDEIITRLIPMLDSQRLFPLWLMGGKLKDINYDEIGFNVYNQMRLFPTIRFALNLIKTPILAQVSKATVDCADPSIKRAVEYAFIESGLLYTLAKQMMRSLDMGISINEKVWHVEDVDLTYDFTDEDGVVTDESAWQGPMLIIKDFQEVNPTAVTEIKRRNKPENGKPADGSFDGFVFNGGDGQVDVPCEKSFVHTHDKEYGSLWGRPLDKGAYPYWKWSNVLQNLAMAWAERKVSPTRLVRYPVGVNSRKVDNQTTALLVGNSMDNVGTTALPSDVDAVSGKYRWDVVEFQISDKSQIFDALLKILDRYILWAIGVPERVFTEAQFGTRAEAETHTDMFLLTLDTRILDAELDINRYGVKPFVVVNFGGDAPPAMIRIPGITDEQRAMLRNVYMTVIADPANIAKVDFEQLSKQFSVPFKDVQEPVDTALPANGAPPAAPTDTTGATTEPSNIIMSDDNIDYAILADIDELELAGFDPNHWTVTEDSSSLLGYKVVNKTTGVRISGMYAKKVIDSYLNYGKSQAKQAQAAAAKAQRQATAAAKKREATAAKTEREAIKAQKAAEREAAKEERQQAAAQKKAENQQARQEKAAQAAQIKAEREAAHQQATLERTQQHEQGTQLANAKAERAGIEKQTSQQSHKDATSTLQQKGYSVLANVADHDTALAQLRELAKADPHDLFTMVKTKDGYALAKKPRNAFSKEGPPTNVAASDAEADDELDFIQMASDLLRELAVSENGEINDG